VIPPLGAVVLAVAFLVAALVGMVLARWAR